MARQKHTAKVNLTASRVSALTCTSGESEVYLWDSSRPGLGLRARSSGSRSYIFQRRLGRQNIKITIGSPDNWDIDQAREEAGRLARLISAQKVVQISCTLSGS